MYYRVRWAGYTAADDTWEPARNLKACPSFIEEFLEQKKQLQEEKAKVQYFNLLCPAKLRYVQSEP